MISSTRELLAERPDVWRFVAEPYHLPDWWPAYQAVHPDRRGLAPGARWRVAGRPWKASLALLTRRPDAEFTIEIRTVVEGWELRWFDLALQLEAGVALDNAGTGRTRATVYVDGAPWRMLGAARSLPREAAKRLYDLVQTAATL